MLYSNFFDNVYTLISFQRVLYNRVPKCGSRSALTLFKSLSVKNGFKVIDPKKNTPYALNEQDQVCLPDVGASAIFSIN